jgi:ribosomal protein L29
MVAVIAKTSKQLRAMSDEELAEYMSGWKEQSPNYILCEMEF